MELGEPLAQFKLRYELAKFFVALLLAFLLLAALQFELSSLRHDAFMLVVLVAIFAVIAHLKSAPSEP